MRRLIFVFSAVVMFLFCSVYASSAQTMMLQYDGGTHEYNGEVYSLVVNNQVLNPPLSPIVFNDRALVPVREIFEEVGATVSYENETQTIEVMSDHSNIKLRINDNVAYINGGKTNIPDNVVPKLIAKVGGETKTMVPVRFISESIGLDVEFDADDGAILIDSDGFEIAGGSNDISDIEPAASPVYVTDIDYEATDNQTVVVNVHTDGDAESYSDFSLEEPKRVVLDIKNGRLGKISENIAVNKSGVTSIRLGDNDERARIVIDAANMKDYDVERLSSDVLQITVVSKAQPISTPNPVSTPKPAASPAQKTAAPSNYKPRPSADKLIVLDAGHGGSDPGAIGELDGKEIDEKNLTLSITNKVKSILVNEGYNVSMTRTGDTLPSLVERPTQANEENAALFVSIHINSAEASEAKGTEVWYSEENNGDSYGTTSAKLAKNILDRMINYMNSANRGVKTANHAVTRRCNMPAALAEVGFISNEEELKNMTSDEYQQKAAQGIAEGIMATLRDIVIPEK